MATADPRAMLLDLDDTIINYGGNTDAAWRTVCDDAAHAVDGLDAAALLAEIHRVRTWYWSDPDRHREGRADLRAASRRIVEQALRHLGYAGGDLAPRIAEAYRDRREAAMQLFPGALETLQRWRNRGITLGLVTNGTGADQRAKIERFALAPYFEHILIEGEFGCGKPDARVYRAALDGVRATPAQTWFVGDNLEWDIAAPQRLGLFTVWVDNARSGLPAEAAVRPHRIVNALAELS